MLPHAFPLLWPPLTRAHRPKALPFGLLRLPIILLLIILFLFVSPSPQTHGNSTVPTYDASGLLTSLSDDDGNHQTFAYDNGVVASVTDQSGRVVTFSYDTAAGNPVLADVNRGGVATAFAHDAVGRLTERHQDTDGDGTADTMNASWSYEESGRASGRMVAGRTVLSAVNYVTGVIQRTDSLGRTTLTSTNADRLPVTAVDALGNQRWFAYADTTRKWNYERDALGRVRRFDHDARGNMVWAQNPDGTTATAAYATIAGAERPLEVRDELGTPTTFEYDDKANCTAVVNALGQRAETTFDSRGRPVTRRDPAGAVTTMVWNDRSNLVAVRDALGNERSSSFDILGNETSSSDARGNQTQRQFDDLRRVVAETLPADASGQQATVRYVYDGEGRVVRSVDAKGHETVFTYDGFGRLLTTTDALGHVTTNTWDEAGRLVETKDARGNVTRFQHDALDRVVRTVDALGNASESDFDAAGRTVATRDAAGNETSFVFDARDRVVEVHGPDGAITFFEYDAAGRRTAMVDPVGRRTEYDHDLLGRVIVQRRFLDGAPLETLSEFDEQGNRTAVTDEAGRTTRFRYDLLGRLTETEDPAGGITKRDYDADSNMVRYVNAKGSAWEFDYDALSRVVAERDPLGHESLFRYDLNGNLVWKRDPKGQETVLTYDALNRLTRVDYADGEWASFSFDENGNRTQIEGADGQRVAQTFDEVDRVRTITHSALDRQLSYEYTATGARGAFEVRDLQNGLVERTSYEWDQAGRPVAIRPPTGDVVAYRYAPDGAREGATLPNGVDVGYQYDSLGRLVEMTYRDPSSREIAFFRYTYSTAGNRTSQVDTEGLTQYTYGALDRLVEARYPDGSFEKFTWDQVGNRLSHEDPDGITSYAYDPGDRLLATTGAKPSSFTWDHNGNMLSKTDPEGTVAYRWNARDRLVRVDLPDGASNLYRYLPESDLRFSVTDKTGAETRFLWDGENVVEELTPTNDSKSRFIEGPGMDQHLGKTGYTGTRTYIVDALGNVRQMLAADGTVALAVAYKAFGGIRSSSGPNAGEYGFIGRHFDGDTGDFYLRARQYSPELGRFLSPDPAGYPPYAYAEGNPVLYSDPTGKSVRDLLRMNSGMWTPHSSANSHWELEYRFLGLADSPYNFTYSLSELPEDVLMSVGMVATGGAGPAAMRMMFLAKNLELSRRMLLNGENAVAVLWDQVWEATGIVAIAGAAHALGRVFCPGSPAAKAALAAADDAADEVGGAAAGALRNVGDSRILRANMEALGINAPKGYHAHHIVPHGSTDPFWVAARKMLSNFLIDIDDAVNGVFLPGTKRLAATTQAAAHSTVHTNLNRDMIVRLLRRARTRDEAIAVLRAVAAKLESGGLN